MKKMFGEDLHILVYYTSMKKMFGEDLRSCVYVCIYA